MNDETKHTPFVIGGIYTRRDSNGITLYGTLAEATVTTSGARTGVIGSERYRDECVQENNETLDIWTLYAAPVTTGAIADLLDRVAALEAKIESLTPQPVTVAPTATADLDATRKRVHPGRISQAI